MEKMLKMFMELCKDSIQKELPDNLQEKYKDADWEQLYELCKLNGLDKTCFRAASQVLNAKENGTILEEWQNDSFGSGMIQLMKIQALQTVLKEAKEREIGLTVFKGVVIADLYPQFTMRVSGDSDIYVAPEQREEAFAMLLDLGYVQDEEKSKEMVPVFHKGKTHTIELHYSLWEDYTGEKMDVLDSYKLTDPSSYLEMDVCGIHVTTLGYTEHFIFQIFHVVKHFIVEGVGFRYLIDLALYANRYYEQIDWDRFWNCMKELDYTRFVEILLGCCQCFLGMTERILQGRQEVQPEEMQVLLSEVIRLSKGNDKDAYQLLGIMTSYLTGTRKAADKKWKRSLQVLFPGRESLSDNYMYAKKCPVLIPAAWVHRGVLFALHHHQKKDDWYNAQEKLSAAEYRIALLEKLHLSE